MPAHRRRDTRAQGRRRRGQTFKLGELFPRADAVDPHAQVITINLGVGVYESGEPKPFYTRPWASEWRVPFARDWLVDGVRGSLGHAFARWIAGGERAEHAQRRSQLLLRRERILRHGSHREPGARESPAAGTDSSELERAIRCTARAKDDALSDAASGRTQRSDARAELLRDLAGLTDASPNERFLGAYLGLEDRALARRTDDAERDRYLGVYQALYADVTLPAKLRALSERELTYAWDPNSPVGPHLVMLANIAAVADDPVMALTARLAIAEFEADDRKRAAALDALLEPFTRIEGYAEMDEFYALVTDIGEAHLAIGDAADAARAYAKCLDAASFDEDGSDDGWLCGAKLAESLDAMSGADGDLADLTIPLRVLGPVALATVKNAVGTLDRNEILRAGKLAMERVPDAHEAPVLLAYLAAAASDPGEKRAFITRRGQDFTRESPWYVREATAAAAVNLSDESFKALLDPGPITVPDAPTSDDEWLVEVRDERAPLVLTDCTNDLVERATLTIHVDTSSGAPVTSITSTKPAPRSTACLEHDIARRFRSIPPANITWVLKP